MGARGHREERAPPSDCCPLPCSLSLACPHLKLSVPHWCSLRSVSPSTRGLRVPMQMRQALCLVLGQGLG